MKTFSFLLGTSLFGHTLANPRGFADVFTRDDSFLPTRRGCQVSDDGGSKYSVSRQFPRQENTTFPSSMTVDVNFHIASTEEDEHLITDDIIAAQFDVLKTHFGAQDINLVLNSTSRVVDNRTGQAFLVNEAAPLGYNYVYYKEEYDAYLKSTRLGGYDALNLYFYSSYSPGATGYCQFPTRDPVSDALFWTDSCQISALTMPGIPADRAFEDWHLGHIAVHEAGHWFGLNHTFAGGCGATGDFVDDTPATRDSYGCPVDSDTCPDSLGLDPIHNLMGYNTDECTSEFTPGQKTRMFTSFFSYRRRGEI